MNTLHIFLLGMPSGGSWILIALAVLLLFGGKKIPELMKGLGGGIKEFKKASKEEDNDDKIEEKK
ncbi:twin-arginine translocase TatA/TatE family subunit [Polaribacter marinivivus]|jgi:sec-independent protein translocase protein TatA|uniref:Sec-independent protein translocase protein TatA n=1 Tax=Polaribacter marinivivus TaxID=1524260 RepID=A0ABV8R6V7_9FLAO|nr:twin-arginine translocase TatA/TatE family subunit [uncultured Polaribacter sp.]